MPMTDGVAGVSKDEMDARRYRIGVVLGVGLTLVVVVLIRWLGG